MGPEFLLTLLGFPISLLANLTYERVKQFSEKIEPYPFQDLFIKTFYMNRNRIPCWRCLKISTANWSLNRDSFRLSFGPPGTELNADGPGTIRGRHRYRYRYEKSRQS